MNCTAWNSVRANALTRRPSAIPEDGVADRERDYDEDRARDVEIQRAEGGRRHEGRLEHGHGREGDPVQPSSDDAESIDDDGRVAGAFA
jgi:hypothetical protein